MNQEELLPGRLTRYRKIIPDWEDFLTCSTRPLPVSVRVNTLRIAPEALAERLAQKGFHLTPIPWADDLFVVEGMKVAKTIEHWLGLFYIQEAVQTVPVRLLDPRPGEWVLDLCAAPGGKCTQIAVRMENKGLLVANEPNGRRQSSLLASLNRFGALNASVTSYRGESFPLRVGFDRVLVDAPCSAEGTLRKERSLHGGAFTATIERLVRLQQRLILRGYDLLRPGGRLVYSTCAFAPEENEAIVAFLLGKRDATIEPINLNFSSSQGVREWEGTIFPASIAGCARIYPHQIDSGGGFVARFRKPS